MTMGLRTTIRWGCGVCAVVCCVWAPGVTARTAQQRRPVELTPWERAEQGREALEAIPDAVRTRADYTRAMEGFRDVYHDAPGDVHAPDSVNAVAELLVEQGRGLHDEKSLKAAVGQYEFLRTQYPASSLRVAALLAEAQIDENDLHDAGAARERYALLVKQYPRSSQAEEAQAGLASLDQSTGHRPQSAGNKDTGHKNEAASADASTVAKGGEAVSSFAPMRGTRDLNRASRRESGDRFCWRAETRSSSANGCVGGSARSFCGRGAERSGPERYADACSEDD